MSEEMAAKAMELVKSLRPEEDEEEAEADRLEQEGKQVAASEMIDAMTANDTDGFVKALENFIRIARI